MQHVVLLRGINVGGRNKVPMAELRTHLAADFRDVRTYIQSGNIVLSSSEPPSTVAAHVEQRILEWFTLDSALIRTLVLDAASYQQVLEQAPAGFGAEPETYRYDVGFFIDVTADDVRPHLPTHPEVDVVSFGDRAFYHQRLIALASRSRLNKVVGSPVYRFLTLRNWSTTTALARMLEEGEAARS